MTIMDELKPADLPPGAIDMTTFLDRAHGQTRWLVHRVGYRIYTYEPDAAKAFQVPLPANVNIRTQNNGTYYTHVYTTK